jgi:hypothetical protein
MKLYVTRSSYVCQCGGIESDFFFCSVKKICSTGMTRPGVRPSLTSPGPAFSAVARIRR